MDEFSRDDKEMMCETIERCLETGICENGHKLSKRGFEMMFQIASGVNPVNVAENNQ